VTVEEIKAMAQHLHMDESEFAMRYLRQRDQRYALVEMKARNYDCVFLKDGKCRIYECRPRQCQTFPWWKENLSSPEQWQRTAQMCEGISDDAPVVPYEEIQKSLHEPEGHD
jgi:Fe-S-cluster containining protein